MRGPFLVLLLSMFALGQVVVPADGPEAVLAVRRAAAEAIERADDLLGT